MKKLTIYTLSLNYGGAERVITNIANMLASNYKVTIKSIYKLNELPFYELDPSIDVIYLTNLKPNRKEFEDSLHKLKLIKAFKEGIKSLKILHLKKSVLINEIKKDNSDIIITTRKEHNYILSKYALDGVIKIGEEHNDFENKKDIKKVIKGAKNLDYFMPASLFLKEKYQKLLSGEKVKVVYIPHSIKKMVKNNIEKENKVIAVGRLEKVKAFNDLLDVFALVLNIIPDLKLSIVGDGSEMINLKKYALEKHIEENVSFKGYMEPIKIEEEYSKSKMLISTSLSESFGLVVIEAANAGIPSVAFDSARGFSEIIENEKTGILIPKRDKEAMASAIIDLLKNEEKLNLLSNNAKESVSIYYEENIKKEWIKFLNMI